MSGRTVKERAYHVTGPRNNERVSWERDGEKMVSIFSSPSGGWFHYFNISGSQVHWTVWAEYDAAFRKWCRENEQ